MIRKYRFQIELGVNTVSVNVAVSHFDGIYSAKAHVPYSTINGDSDGMSCTSESDAIFYAMAELGDNLKMHILSQYKLNGSSVKFPNTNIFNETELQDI